MKIVKWRSKVETIVVVNYKEDRCRRKTTVTGQDGNQEKKCIATMANYL